MTMALRERAIQAWQSVAAERAMSEEQALHDKRESLYGEARRAVAYVILDRFGKEVTNDELNATIDDNNIRPVSYAEDAIDVRADDLMFRYYPRGHEPARLELLEPCEKCNDIVTLGYAIQGLPKVGQLLSGEVLCAQCLRPEPAEPELHLVEPLPEPPSHEAYETAFLMSLRKIIRLIVEEQLDAAAEGMLDDEIETRMEMIAEDRKEARDWADDPF